MQYVVTAEEMKALDAAAIDGIGLPGIVLMENAGRAVARVVEELLPIAPGGHTPRVAVVCGAGNNGGDGYVIARCLREVGLQVTVYLAAARKSIQGDARLHLDVYENVGGLVVPIADERSLFTHREAIRSADAVVDAVFGTGLTRDVTGHYRHVIDFINQCRHHRVAVDIPSGLSADTGEVLGGAVDATVTVTMAFLKIGMVTAPGFTHCGEVHVAEIGIPAALAKQHGIRVALVEPADMARVLPSFALTTHKNRRGHVLAVAGSPGKRGAGRLVAAAAMRTGAGLVTLSSPWAYGEIWAPDPVMTAELDPDIDPQAGADGWAQVSERFYALASDKQVVAMGPGMPATPGGQALVYTALSNSEQPLVLDADALNHLGTDLATVAQCSAPVIMTPHPGEAARLLGISTTDVQRDRLAAVRTLAEQSRATVVLKGARTMVCHEGFVTINPMAHSALATAGSGDVLTGIIAALLAQGAEAVDAARLGVYIHGLTGARAAETLGSHGVTASDLVEEIPAVMSAM